MSVYVCACKSGDTVDYKLWGMFSLSGLYQQLTNSISSGLTKLQKCMGGSYITPVYCGTLAVLTPVCVDNCNTAQL